MAKVSEETLWRRKERLRRINITMEAIERLGGYGRFGPIRDITLIEKATQNAVMKSLELCEYITRNKREIPRHPGERVQGPRQAFYYSITALGHQQMAKGRSLRTWVSRGNEDALDQRTRTTARAREVSTEAGRRMKARCENSLKFIQQTEDRGRRIPGVEPHSSLGLGPIEARFRGHHYYDPHKQRYID